MYLVDKNIKIAVENNQLITTGFVPENLKGIAYELTIDSIYNESNKNLCYLYAYLRSRYNGGVLRPERYHPD